MGTKLASAIRILNFKYYKTLSYLQGNPRDDWLSSDSDAYIPIRARPETLPTDTPLEISVIKNSSVQTCSAKTALIYNISLKMN